MAQRDGQLPVVRARGNAGALRVGYQTAARLGRWDLSIRQAVPRAFRLTAEVASVHDYWVTQGPFDLVLALGRVAWVWRGVAADALAGQLVVDITERPAVEPLEDHVQGDGRP